ncbi:MAG: alpha/beta hydrolase [Bacteroidetes bacterium]|nr:alpha/beta hydrolase [Bacteroidota bacterium]
MPYKIINHLIPALHGHLEAVIFQTPLSERVMIVTHPHPLFGGNLHNKVVYSLADEARKLGIYAVRFNFRGVGKSTGIYDDTLGETTDLKAVIHWVIENTEAKEIILAGFSFGSRVILRLLEEGFLPKTVIMAGLPVQFFKLDPPVIKAEYPILFIQGESDEYTTPEATASFISKSGFSNREIITLSNCDHFFTGHIHLLKQHVHTFLTTHLQD